MMEEEKVEETVVQPPVLQHSIETMNVEVRVLTLNVWGVPVVSKDRIARLEAICHQIVNSTEQYHYVMFQEVWRNDDYKLLAEKLKTSLPYSHYFYSGVIGSGMCVFSCTPFTSVQFFPWSINGLPHKIHHADWWGGKGLALATTNYNGCNLVIASTHLHAEYQSHNDEYLHHRTVQAYETSQVLRWLPGTDHTIIFGGDLNAECSAVPYRLMRHNGHLRDAFVDAPNKPVDGIGATNETPGNSYTSLASLRADPTGKRIDHILYRPADNVKMKVKLCDLPWPLRVPGASYSFSDHEAVRAVFSIERSSDGSDDGTTVLSSNGPSPQHFNNHHNTVAGKNGDLKGSLAGRGTDRDSTLLRQTLALHEKTDALLDSAAICAQGLRSIKSSWRRYAVTGGVSALVCLVLICVICSAAHNMSGGTVFILMALLMLVSAILLYSLWLLVIWNKIEHHSVLSMQMGVECMLEDLRKKNAIQYQKTSFLEKSSNK